MSISYYLEKYLEEFECSWHELRVALARVSPAHRMPDGSPRRRWAEDCLSRTVERAVSDVLRDDFAAIKAEAHILAITECPPLPTAEAAVYAGVKPATIRQWVKRGILSPVDPSASRHTFRLLDVRRAYADGNRGRRNSRTHQDPLMDAFNNADHSASCVCGDCRRN